MLSQRTLLASAAAWLAVHAAVWAVVAAEPTRYPWPQDVSSLLEHWDAWHYGLISTEGYAGVRWAYYPLYPRARAGDVVGLALPARVADLLGLPLEPHRVALPAALVPRTAVLAARPLEGGGRARGACALTKNQGVFVAVAVALDSSLCLRGELRKRALVFTASGAIIATLFALRPAYQYRATGEWAY